jgi:pyridoxal phosphate enzyme (YggS family)
MVNQTFLDNFRQTYPDITVVAVTKYTDVAGVLAFWQAGIRDFGENRADAFLPKQQALPEATWHFIGHLQTNKVKQIIDHVDVLHSLDRYSLAVEIQKRATKVVKCMIQVKTTSDEKFGMMVDEVSDFLTQIAHFDKIQVVGVMTMAEDTTVQARIVESFQQAKAIQRQYHLPYCSIGMSNDYPLAIEAGATHVRLGRILYQGD